MLSLVSLLYSKSVADEVKGFDLSGTLISLFETLFTLHFIVLKILHREILLCKIRHPISTGLIPLEEI